jgi:hypothetical protein
MKARILTFKPAANPSPPRIFAGEVATCARPIARSAPKTFKDHMVWLADNAPSDLVLITRVVQDVVGNALRRIPSDSEPQNFMDQMQWLALNAPDDMRLVEQMVRDMVGNQLPQGA